MVSIPSQVALHHSFEPFALHVRSGECAWIEKNFPYIFSQIVSIPDAKIEDLVSTQKQTFPAKKRDGMVDTRQPLRHPHVVGIFRLKRELEKSM